MISDQCGEIMLVCDAEIPYRTPRCKAVLSKPRTQFCIFCCQCRMGSLEGNKLRTLSPDLVIHKLVIPSVTVTTRFEKQDPERAHPPAEVPLSMTTGIQPTPWLCYQLSVDEFGRMNWHTGLREQHKFPKGRSYGCESISVSSQPVEGILQCRLEHSERCSHQRKLCIAVLCVHDFQYDVFSEDTRLLCFVVRLGIDVDSEERLTRNEIRFFPIDCKT